MNEEHFQLIWEDTQWERKKEECKEWNQWRRDHEEVEVNLKGANLLGRDFTRANLKGANLQDSVLSGTRLFEANLEGANLSGANLQFADLSGANLKDANLEGARLNGAILENVQNLTAHQLCQCRLIEDLKDAPAELLEEAREKCAQKMDWWEK